MRNAEPGRRENGVRDRSGTPLMQLGVFLRSRRERLDPAAVGLPASRHRTPGLRREDVAELAGLSVAWYERIEQGRDVHPSAAALRSIAAALRLGGAERDYAFRLAGMRDPDSAQAFSGVPPVLRALDLVPTPEAPDGTPPALRSVLDSMTVPALLMDRYWDVVGRNTALEAFVPGLAPVRTRPDQPPRNVVRHVLTTHDAGERTREWEVLARACVGGLRTSLAAVWAERPDDPHAAALIANLARESVEFRAWWPEHQVWAADRPLRQVYEHANLGGVLVEFMLLDMRSAPGLTLVTYVPGDNASAAKLQQLARQHEGPAG